MPRALVYTSPARGHLYPAVDIALGLRRRGFDVELHGLAAEVPALPSLGFEVHPLDPQIEALPLDDATAKTALGALRRVVSMFVRRAPLEVTALQKRLRAQRPDLMLIDINTWGAAAVAEASEIPWALFSPYLLPLPSRDAPPFGLGLRPRQDWLGRVRDALVLRTIRAALGSFTKPLNTIRAAVGAAALEHVVDFPLTAPCMLAMTAEPFEYAHSDWPACVHLCGPATWSPPAPAFPWASQPGPPLVLVTASTETQDDARLIEIALAAFADTDVRVVATTAAHDPAGFAAAANARVVRFVSHDAILPHAAAVICHGGMGITQRALAAGVPVCVVPHGRDQLEVGRRVERAQAGVFLSRDRLTAATLREAVVATRALRPGAARIASAFRQAGGGDRAAEILSTLCKGVSTP